MAQNHNIISFGNAKREHRLLLDEKIVTLVNRCRNQINRSLPQLSDGMFEKLDDALFELSDKAGTDAQQTIYFDVMREIRKQRNQIQKNFIQGSLNRFDHFWRHGPVADPQEKSLREAGLSLMDNDDLEESLAISNMASKSENQYKQELQAIEQRFAAMLKVEEVSHYSNPISPANLCASFQAALQHLEVVIQIKLVIYKLFDKQMSRQLGGLYQEMGNMLGNAGILPMLISRARRTTALPATKNDSNRLPEAQQETHCTDEESMASEVFSNLQQLLNLHRQQGGVSSNRGESSNLPPVNTAELLGALTSLQHNATAQPAAARGSTDGAEHLKTTLLNSLGGLGAKSLGQVDDDVIDIIAMLFEFILDDKNLPNAMKALLSRLQIPMLKVAILDKSFLSRKKHPARQLLNRLAQAAFAWSEVEECSTDELYLKIESIVQRILSEFDNDMRLFEVLDQEFTELQERELHRSSLAEQRAQQNSKGKAQLLAARCRVSEEIEKRLDGREVPQIIATLLHEGWRDVLILINLRQGLESKAWKESLALMDRLLWSIEPKSEHAERQKLLKQIPSILKVLRAGLNSISYDQCKMAKLFHELQECHFTVLHIVPSPSEAQQKQKAQPPVKPVVEALPVKPSQEVEEIVLESPCFEEDEGDEFDHQVEFLAIGNWLEIIEENGIKIRAKLSWRSATDNSLVFVNRRGIRVLEISANGLATLFRAERAVVLRDLEVPLMDRAISSMMDALNNLDEKQSSKRA